jgi:hypothetical protein
MATAALLLPLTAATESQIRTGATSTSLSATAQLNFKIIIPKVLYLQLGREGVRVEGPQTVTIVSNSRNVTLNASVDSSHADDTALGRVILSSGARKAISQEAVCTVGEQRGATAAANGGRLLCTASIP